MPPRFLSFEELQDEVSSLDPRGRYQLQKITGGGNVHGPVVSALARTFPAPAEEVTSEISKQQHAEEEEEEKGAATQKMVVLRRVNLSLFSEDPEESAKFLQEVQLLTHFNDNGIASLRDVLFDPSAFSSSTSTTAAVEGKGENSTRRNEGKKGKQKRDRIVFLVQDHFAVDLQVIIRSTRQKLSEGHVRYFLYQALRSLNIVHEAGVVHRDIKPENLLATTSCFLCLANFSMAKCVSNFEEQEEEEIEADYTTTRWYRAPETVLESIHYSQKLDVWGLGCVFAELFLRRALCPGRSHIDQLDQILKVVGPPSNEDVQSMQVSSSAKKFLYERLQKLPDLQRVDFSKKFPEASATAIDLLSKMLVFNAEKRISVREALTHPFFESLYDPKEIRSATASVKKFVFDLNDEDRNTEELIHQFFMGFHHRSLKPKSSSSFFKGWSTDGDDGGREEGTKNDSHKTSRASSSSSNGVREDEGDHHDEAPTLKHPVATTLEGQRRTKEEGEETSAAAMKAGPEQQEPQNDVHFEFSMEPDGFVGKGSFGTVYRARNESTGTLIAVKKIRPAGPRELEAVAKEIKTLRRLHHPHIIQYLGFQRRIDPYYGSSSSLSSSSSNEYDYFILMEYAEGGSLLSQLLKNDDSRTHENVTAAGVNEEKERSQPETNHPLLDLKTISRFTRQILDSLQYLHDEQKIAHRDLKAANILLDVSHKVVKLGDFGTCKDEGATHNTFAGSFNWMAPEVIQEEKRAGKLACACDIWSLGCVVVEMLSGGKAPFFWTGKGSHAVMNLVGSGGSNLEMALSQMEPAIAAIRQGPSQQAGQANQQHQQHLKLCLDLVRRCLVYDSEKRPTATELLEHQFIQYFTGGKGFVEEKSRSNNETVSFLGAREGSRKEKLFANPPSRAMGDTNAQDSYSDLLRLTTSSSSQSGAPPPRGVSGLELSRELVVEQQKFQHDIKVATPLTQQPMTEEEQALF